MGLETPFDQTHEENTQNRRQEILPGSEPPLRANLEPLRPLKTPPVPRSAQRQAGAAAGLSRGRTTDAGQRVAAARQPPAGLHLLGDRREPHQHDPGRLHGVGGSVAGGRARVGARHDPVGGAAGWESLPADGGADSEEDRAEFGGVIGRRCGGGDRDPDGEPGVGAGVLMGAGEDEASGES